MAGLFDSRNALAPRPQFTQQEMGPPQPYQSAQDVFVNDIGKNMARGFMFTPELMAEAGVDVRQWWESK